jgi:hypothetical protein
MAVIILTPAAEQLYTFCLLLQAPNCLAKMSLALSMGYFSDLIQIIFRLFGIILYKFVNDINLKTNLAFASKRMIRICQFND